MLKKFVLIAVTAAAVVSVSAQPTNFTPQETDRARSLHLSNGRLYVNGELVFKNFSIGQSDFKYLFFYVPSRGLFIISDHQFEGSVQGGTFEGRTLSLRVGDIDLKVESSVPLLRGEQSAAWVKFDSNFKLDVKSVMFGYGDKETMPYAWPEQIRKNRR
ncbi:MAG: hypothetical protein ICV60_23145 [Pyrinomonadaceae bacterium]|nr:hypothetical protein [Pyrinomonadaceae bacterium]